MTFDEQMGTLAGLVLVIAAPILFMMVGLWVLRRLMPYVIGVLMWLGVIE